MTEIITTLKKLIEVRFKILKSEILDEISSIATRVGIILLMVLSASFILLFGSISLAFYFSELYGSTSLGFLLLTGIYLLLFVLLYLLRNARFFQKGLKNSLSRYVFLFTNKKD
ncbi:MAG: phage holin family protein [Cyclobacterium sp.]|uniref:phage holin family protein n=1 Tax=unclassified Cyclobacterium TaxID=2615055 RepID=UPI0013D7D9D7|nr:phage holin family protein [Cyclobacterium sp. SYSU L10401]